MNLGTMETQVHGNMAAVNMEVFLYGKDVQLIR